MNNKEGEEMDKDELDLVADIMKKEIALLREAKIKKLRDRIKKIRKKDDLDVLSKQDKEILGRALLMLMENPLCEKFFFKKARKYFKKIYQDMFVLRKEYKEYGLKAFNRGYHDLTHHTVVEFSSKVKAIMLYIAKEKPPEVNNFLALIILKLFAVEFKAGRFLREAIGILEEEKE